MVINNKNRSKSQRILDIPSGTLVSTVLLAISFFILKFIGYDKKIDLIINFSFTPNLYSSFEKISLYHLMSPFTYTLIHIDTTHFFINFVSLLAFGSAIERKYHTSIYLITLIVSSVSGIFLHYLFYYNSDIPVIGASGGICGLMSFVIIDNLNMKEIHYGKIIKILILFISLFFLISIVDILPSIKSQTIAWVVHTGGFISGIIIFITYKIIYKK